MRQSVDKKEWAPMKLTKLGQIGDVVRGGGGKLSPTTHDTGDNRKPPGQA
jgi:hypothetical protein